MFWNSQGNSSHFLPFSVCSYHSAKVAVCSLKITLNISVQTLDLKLSQSLLHQHLNVHQLMALTFSVSLASVTPAVSLSVFSVMSPVFSFVSISDSSDESSLDGTCFSSNRLFISSSLFSMDS